MGPARREGLGDPRATSAESGLGPRVFKDGAPHTVTTSWAWVLRAETGLDF